MRDSFVFYRSFWEAMKELPDKDIADTMKAIAGYALDGIEPTEPGIAKSIYIMARPQIDANNKRYENGKRGGKPTDNQTVTKREPMTNQTATKEEPNRNQRGTKAEPNVNVNVNDNVNVNANENVNENVNANVKDKKTILADAKDLFERLWRLYPCKKGKGQVSDTQKKRLLAIGEAELVKAIERYSSELQKDAGWRKPQNGSTFFNSGYVDYLDDNFVPSEDKPKSTGSAYIDAINNRMDVVDEWLRKRQEAHDDG